MVEKIKKVSHRIWEIHTHGDVVEAVRKEPERQCNTVNKINPYNMLQKDDNVVLILGGNKILAKVAFINQDDRTAKLVYNGDVIDDIPLSWLKLSQTTQEPEEKKSTITRYFEKNPDRTSIMISIGGSSGAGSYVSIERTPDGGAVIRSVQSKMSYGPPKTVPSLKQFSDEFEQTHPSFLIMQE